MSFHDSLFNSSFGINDLASGGTCQIFDSGAALFGGSDICAGTGADFLASTSMRMDDSVRSEAEAWRIAREEDDFLAAAYLLS